MPRVFSSSEVAGGARKLDDATISLLRMIYAAMVYAVETYDYMLEVYRGLTPDQRRKLEACRRLEVMMTRRLHDHLTIDLGLEVRRPRRARQAAEMLARLEHGSWADRMSDLEAVAIRGVSGFRSLKAIHGERAPNLCASLLAKDMAVRDMARDELDGEPGGGFDRVLALLSPEDREAVQRLDIQ